ncbi:hypothetical protein D3C75_1024790 [compost metagenome]
MISGVSQGTSNAQVNALTTPTRSQSNNEFRILAKGAARSMTALTRGVMASSTGRLIDNNVLT